MTERQQILSMAQHATPIRPRSALLTTAAVVCALIAASPARSSPGSIIASSGFTPARNGFSFPNYGPGYANLDANTMRNLFGNDVCASLNATRGCVLTPPAQAYLTAANRQMAGGHCFGMSALALLIYRHLFPPLDGTPISRLKLKGDALLQHAIAYAFQWQLLSALSDEVVDGTPNKVLRFLTDSLRRRGGELYTMTIYKPGYRAGHAVTPYAVTSLGNGQYDVLVYDNNWPGQAREVHFDTRTDTWSYVAATSRSVRGSLYQGNARTRTVRLLPTTPGLGVHDCPFCGAGAAGSAAAYDELELQGNPYNHAQLLIRDPQGRALGYQAGRLVNGIPGARIVDPAALDDWQEPDEPVYQLPADIDLKVTINGSALRYPDTEHLSVIGPDHDLAIDGILMRPGERETLTVNGGPQPSITYRSAGTETLSPSFDVGLVRTAADDSMAAQALALRPGSVITIGDDTATSTLSVHDSGGSQTFELHLTRDVAGRVGLPLAFKVEQPAGKTIELLYGNNVPAGQSRIRLV